MNGTLEMDVTINLSTIAEHAFNNPDHQILFNKVEVLAKTEKYIPRIIKEAVEIIFIEMTILNYVQHGSSYLKTLEFFTPELHLCS